MNHQDHVNLLRNGVAGPGGVWADFGSGQGAFTLALAELIGSAGVIYSVDKNRSALRRQEQLMDQRFQEVTVHYQTADFTKQLDLPLLDGIVVANALHFLRHKQPTIQLMRNYLRGNERLQTGRLLIVEYNTDRGNIWVPHPFSYSTWVKLATRNGFTHTELLATRPSRFLGEIYAAASW